jgi:hypothetical protein
VVGQLDFMKWKLFKEQMFFNENDFCFFRREACLAEELMRKDNMCLHYFLFFLQASLQKRISSQQRSHFFLHVKGRKQVLQTLVGK